MTVHAGDQLDHYRIDALVARSGMASIFRATDTRLGREVAIKTCREEFSELGVALAQRGHVPICSSPVVSWQARALRPNPAD